MRSHIQGAITGTKDEIMFYATPHIVICFTGYRITYRRMQVFRYHQRNHIFVWRCSQGLVGFTDFLYPITDEKIVLWMGRSWRQLGL